ncbi:acyltransferase family protein [Agromyces sp. Marseille-Q5079]|uniref:acyltransferase family protein n=1 Tax=Agromyces sp. Marseille-Q5079 TaxID=3439059 RepID=UPI003D9CB631
MTSLSQPEHVHVSPPARSKGHPGPTPARSEPADAPASSVPEVRVVKERASATTRSVALNALRVLTIGTIVLTHNWAAREWAGPWFYTWHTVLFFVLTGYFWKPQRTARDEVRRRTRTLLVPYLGWLLLVTAVFQTILFVERGRLDVGWLIRAAAGGTHAWAPYSSFWFITALFFAAIFIRILGNLSPFLVWFIAGVGVLWAAADPRSIAAVPESITLALPVMAFISFGILLRTYRPMITKPFVFGIILAVPPLLLGGFGLFAPINLKFGNIGDPIVSLAMGVAIACGLILVAESCERLIPRWAARPVAAIAAVAIPIILGHSLVLWTCFHYGLEPSKATFALAYLIPLAIGLLIARTPLKRVLL